MNRTKISHTSSHFRLRQCIMITLYETFKEYPYAPMELKELAEKCNTNYKNLNWNIIYLEKCGYVELGKSFQNPPYIASSAGITSEGIDLVEDEEKFNSRFVLKDKKKLLLPGQQPNNIN